ncbi:hypothetical protein B0A54_16888 [Friedmanniomyces endolithicus]|uniref:Reverse transcriptase domain-containing protein n=1 Tax=Friedmanniomyces endolithicus TaxID=329885 RepID=A0A4U0TVD7_9PEZI|nr:hypothetical protein B0A54_16888 [Friedmanniomyces endolithicus]
MFILVIFRGRAPLLANKDYDFEPVEGTTAFIAKDLAPRRQPRGYPAIGKHCDRFSVVSYCGREHFNVAVIGYCNSVQYVQRKLDSFLREFPFASVYVDDIVIALRTEQEHESYLYAVFGKFKQYNICLSPKKSFIGYPIVTLLGQRVDAFGYSTNADRIVALCDLAFPVTGSNLAHYLGAVG